jgi:hypothetical protein
LAFFLFSLSPKENVMHPVQATAEAWEATAIEKSRNDPLVIAARLCAVCMCSPPCLCDSLKAAKEMRTYYEKNRRIDAVSILGYSIVQGRPEPSAMGSWDTPIDVLMESLYKIAVAGYKEEIAFLRAKLDQNK